MNLKTSLIHGLMCVTALCIVVACQSTKATGKPSALSKIGAWFQSTAAKFNADLKAGEAWAQTDDGKATLNDFVALVQAGVAIEGGGAKSQANVAAIASVARSLESGNLASAPTDSAVISAVSNYIPSGVNTKVVTALQQIAASGPNPNGSLEAAAKAIDATATTTNP